MSQFGSSSGQSIAEARIPFIGDLTDFEAKLAQAGSMLDRMIEDRKQAALRAVGEVYDEIERRQRAVPPIQAPAAAPEPAAPTGPRDGTAAPSSENLHLTNIEAAVENIDKRMDDVVTALQSLAEGS